VIEDLVTRDLKSHEQCTQSARKAQAVLGMVKRHFKELDKEDVIVILVTDEYVLCVLMFALSCNKFMSI